ncbi:MAG: cupin domain-containing protein [Cyanobacteria bacterium]|nr:cupin domain-containing protein [Cyanobacteriota bacterium]
MKRMLPFLVIGVSVVSGATLAAQGGQPQAPGAAAPPQAARPAGGGGEPMPNDRTGFQVGRFFVDPANSTARLSNGGLLTREILRHGDPNVPGPDGAVLEFRTQVARATLLPKFSTPLMSLNSQFLFYVVSGEGRLDDGTQSWDLRNGITMLIPPDVKRRFINTSVEPLEMVMTEWPANAVARKDILVRDVALLPFCEENAHWNNMSKCLFTQADGMTGRVLLVMLAPMTMAAPHTHGPGADEIWTKLTPGNALLMLGSELREMPQYSTFLAPPNNQTWHGQLNTSKTQVDMWLYVAGGNATTPRPAGGGGGGGRGPGAGNPNLSRDQAVVDQATVKGKPLK